MRMRDRLARFMYGRHGSDKLNMAIILTACLIMIVRMFFFRSEVVPVLLYIAAAGLLAWTVFRSMSRNVAARQKENAAFLRFFGRIDGWFKLQSSKRRDRHTHAYRRCPHCRATIRLPLRKGKHGVTCPRCFKHFEVKIRRDAKAKR